MERDAVAVGADFVKRELGPSGARVGVVRGIHLGSVPVSTEVGGVIAYRGDPKAERVVRTSGGGERLAQRSIAAYRAHGRVEVAVLSACINVERTAHHLGE